AYGALAGNLEARDLIEARIDFRIDQERGAAREHDMRDVGDTRLAHAAILEREQDQRQLARGGLERERQIDVIGAELDTQFAQLAAYVLVEALDLVSHG